jgi:hypothetical protein
VDGLGYLRGKYLTPMQALRVGAKAIRNCFKDQLQAMKQEGIDRLGMKQLYCPYRRQYPLLNVRNWDTIRYGQQKGLQGRKLCEPVRCNGCQ